MRLSHDVIVAERPSGSYLLINTCTCRLLEVSGALGSLLARARDHSGLLDLLSASTRNRLQVLGVLVDDDADLQLRHRIVARRLADSRRRTQGFLLATTLRCNLECIYCSQSDLAERPDMTPRVFERAMAWIEQEASQREVETLWVTLTGGEPLLTPDLVLSAIAGTSKLSRELGRRTTALIVTNGVLLGPEVVREHLRAAGDNVQVRYQLTLDGIGAVHDRRRPFRCDGSGTFDLIFSNLLALVSLTNVTIRINVDRENEDAVSPLLQHLDSHGLINHENVSVYAKPTVGYSSAARRVAFSESELPEIFSMLWHCFDAMGLDTNIETTGPYTCGLCGIQQEPGACIGPDGSIYPCQDFVGDGEMVCGSIFDDSPNALYAAMANNPPWKTCIDEPCPVFMLCAGGCRVLAKIETGDWRSIMCERRDFLRDLYVAYIESRLQAATRKAQGQS